MTTKLASHYEVPNWAGKPPNGLHLDVTKDDKLVQKLMVDQKKCYLFGRNKQLNDFCIDHASCSRVHAAFVYHKHLNRVFLTDLGSTHGTYIGSLRLEANKPTQLPIDATFHFGASTRKYILRERPQASHRPIIDELEMETDEDGERAVLNLPADESELDDLTEYNTAQNRRISMLGITDDYNKKNSNRKRKKHDVSFNEDEEIINMEDVDPSIGRFRNLIQTTVVPAANTAKRLKVESRASDKVHIIPKLHAINHDLYDDLPETHDTKSAGFFSNLNALSSKLGISLPNPAPDVESDQEMEGNVSGAVVANVSQDASEPKKKKYAKEAWPGKKPTGAGLF